MAASALRATSNGSVLAEKPRRLYRAEEINALKERDNWTNVRKIAFVYLVRLATVAATLWSFRHVAGLGLGWWWNIPASALAVIIIGAVQHQLGGIVHEGTHYILFANRRFSEAASDWAAAFPLYTSTQAFRLHHLSHHQFVNDPERDSNFAQAKDAGHWLDFPLTHIEVVAAIIRQLNPVRLVRYILARMRYSALGVETNPYADSARPGNPWTLRVGVIYAGAVPASQVALILSGRPCWEAMAVLAAAWATTTFYFWVIPVAYYAESRIDPVISHRWTVIARIAFMTLLYGSITAVDYATGAPAWGFFLLLWVVPLFTSFPLFMILREWVQHGNADRGRYTNSRVFLVNPLVRFAVFPFGMEYHLPHHLFASVPHYKLEALHKLLLRDPDYREKGCVVEGWSKPGENGHPTIIDVLGPDHAPASVEVHVDDATLDLADVNNRGAVERQSKASRRAGARSARVV